MCCSREEAKLPRADGTIRKVACTQHLFSNQLQRGIHDLLEEIVIVLG